MNEIIRGLSLLELLISIVLLSFIVLGLSNIDTFTHWHVISADRKALIQNEVSIALQHMTKEIGSAIGSTVIAAQAPVNITTISGNDAIRVWIDSNGNARFDSYPGDSELAYRFTANTGNPNDRFQIWYYSSCVGPNCDEVGSTAPEVVSRYIASFIRGVTDNYIDVRISACWNPATAVAPYNGTADNPCVTMRNFIKMPSVSTN